MQHRYCTCGCSVWVQYLFDEKRCKVVFWQKSDSSGIRVKVCPYCGRALDIDDLR